jgi:hypothetical protein
MLPERFRILIHIGKFKYPPGYGDGILRMQTQESAVEI